MNVSKPTESDSKFAAVAVLSIALLWEICADSKMLCLLHILSLVPFSILIAVAVLTTMQSLIAFAYGHCLRLLLFCQLLYL